MQKNQQQQQQQLAEQQKKQPQQQVAKGSSSTSSPAPPQQNQQTEPPKASAWGPQPPAAQTPPTLTPAPTTAQLLFGDDGSAPHYPPTMPLPTPDSAPRQHLPPQGGMVTHAPAAVQPWLWNGQPPQQQPFHLYHATNGQHAQPFPPPYHLAPQPRELPTTMQQPYQPMPVLNPQAHPFFTPSAPPPSQLHPQPPMPAPAALPPAPTAATTPVWPSPPIVSAEERRANELLAQQIMAPQPRPLPGAACEGEEEEEEQSEYVPLYSFEGQPLIMAKKTAPSYPAVMINEKDGALVVRVSLFGLSVTVQRNGQLVYLRLRESAEVKNALFTLPLLHAMPTFNGKRSKKAQSGERAALLVAVPQGFDPSKTKFEEGQTLLIITMVRPTLSTRLLTVTTTKTDLL